MCESGDIVQAKSAKAAPPQRRWVEPGPEQVAFPFVAEMPVQPGGLPSLADALKAVPEHRKPRGFKADQPPVPLIPSLLLLLAAVMCGRKGYGDIAEWGRQCITDYPEVLDCLGFPRDRVPRTAAAATIFRLLRDMYLRQFQEALQGWLEAVAKAAHVTLPAWEKEAIPEDQIGLDGKTVRGASARRERGSRGGILHLVAAYAPALKVVLDQVASEGKGHELAAVKLLLGRLPLKDRVITADALATQRAVCTTIQEGGGYYQLPVKENQPALLADIQQAFSPVALPEPKTEFVAAEGKARRGQAETTRAEAAVTRAASAVADQGRLVRNAQRDERAAKGVRPVLTVKLPDVASQERLLRATLPDARLTMHQEAVRKARHGRYEVRTVWALSSADLNAYAGSAGTVGEPWPGLQQVSRIQRVVCERDHQSGQWRTTTEVDYSITNLCSERADARMLLKRWRIHWSIEALHWVRDVTLGEDGSQVHMGQAPEAFSVLRNAATTLLKLGHFESIAGGVRTLEMKPTRLLGLFADLADRVSAAGRQATKSNSPQQIRVPVARAPAT